jgi:UDP-glucose 4-epimerase
MDRASVVITGANGFLGRHVARCFAREGHRVLGIGHGEWPREEWELWGLSGWHRVDAKLQTLKQYADSPSAIVHCAGSGSVAFSIENPLEDFERTTVTTAHVLEYVRLYAPSCRVVYPSSASVYGVVDGVPIREDCRLAPISQYGVHKLMSEQLVASYARLFGAPASIVRLFSLYGPGLRKQLLWDACGKFAVGNNVFMGTGDEVRDWLHVEDAAELLLAAVDHASSDCPTVNGGSGEGVTVRDLLQHLGSSLLKATVIPGFSGAKRVGDPSRYIADLKGAKSWNWRPRRLWRDGVAEYAAWWLDSNEALSRNTGSVLTTDVAAKETVMKGKSHRLS